MLKQLSQNLDPNMLIKTNANYCRLQIKVEDKDVNLHCWDVGGSAPYQSFASLHYRDSQILIAVFDATDRGSFESLKDWIGEYPYPFNPIFIIANKIDRRDLIKQDIRQLAYDLKLSNCYVHLTSAQTGEEIEYLFQKIAEVIVKTYPDHLFKSLPDPAEDIFCDFKSLFKCKI
jgi:GTPase SAR1 family protein